MLWGSLDADYAVLVVMSLISGVVGVLFIKYLVRAGTISIITLGCPLSLLA
jgi:hypothetical protein